MILCRGQTSRFRQRRMRYILRRSKVRESAQLILFYYDLVVLVKVVVGDGFAWYSRLMLTIYALFRLRVVRARAQRARYHSKGICQQFHLECKEAQENSHQVISILVSGSFIIHNFVHTRIDVHIGFLFPWRINCVMFFGYQHASSTDCSPIIASQDMIICDIA